MLASNGSRNVSSGSSVSTPFAASATSGITTLTSSIVTSIIPTLGIASSPIAFPNIGSPTLSSVPFTLPTPSSPPTSAVIVRDIAKSEYRSTTSMSCDLLKSPKLIENGGDNKKRKEMILTILGGEDLLSMLNGTRSKSIATSANPTGYTGRKIVLEKSGEELVMNADDVFYHLHDSRIFFIAITIALSENLQYMFPIATATRIRLA